MLFIHFVDILYLFGVPSNKVFYGVISKTGSAVYAMLKRA